MLLSFIDSPEYLTYLGVIDNLNFLTRHQSKLSIEGLDDISKNWRMTKKFTPKIKKKLRIMLLKGWLQAIKKTLA